MNGFRRDGLGQLSQRLATYIILLMIFGSSSAGAESRANRTLASSEQSTAYLLGPKDKVRVTAVEWRASRGEVFEWKVLIGWALITPALQWLAGLGGRRFLRQRREGEERRQEMERERRAKALSEPKKHFSLRAVKRHANGTIELGVEDKSHAGYEAHL